MTAPTNTTAVVSTEDDPTPLVLDLARTLRSSSRTPELADLLGRADGVAVVRSANDRHVATLRFSGGRAHVTHGASVDAEVELVVDVADGLAVQAVDGPDAEATLEAETRRLLSPPLPDWRDAAQRFWQLTSGEAGMPEQFVIVCTDDGTELVLGSGPSRYELRAPAEKLARILSGVDSFLDEVFAQNVAISGTMPQLSVMAGASWKVKFYA